MELNGPIYAGAKLVCHKIGIAKRKSNKNINLKCKIRLEGRIKKLQQQVKVRRKEKHAKIYRDEKRTKKMPVSLNVQLEEMNQNILVNEGGVKRFRDRLKQSK